MLIFLFLTGLAQGYWEISEGVPTVFSDSAEQQWRLWSGNEAAATLFDNSTGILFDDVKKSIVVGKFTPGDIGTSVTKMGYLAGLENQGIFQSAFGYAAGFRNLGISQSAFGFFAGDYSSGDSQSAFGSLASHYNTGESNSAFGAGACANNDGDFNTGIGAGAFSAFNQDSGNAKVIASVEFADNQVTITAGGGHGFGLSGTYLNLRATSTEQLPSGLSVGPDVWKIINSTVLECRSDSFTDAGTGTHTLTPQIVYEESTAIGYNAEPDADKQIMLGAPDITEVKTAGSLTASGATLGALTVTGNTTLGDEASDTLDVFGITQIGDGGSTNYIQFAADGEMTLHGTARVTKDIPVNADSFKLGSSAPTQAIIGNFSVLQFTGVAITQTINYTFHVPDEWAVGTDMTVHVHWAPVNANAGDVKWQMTYSPIASNSNEVISNAGTTTFIVDSTQTLQDELLESDNMTISGASLAQEDSIGITIFRDPTDPADDYASAASLVLIEITFTMDKHGDPT